MAYFQKHQENQTEDEYRPVMRGARSDAAFFDEYGDIPENQEEDYDDGFDELLEDEEYDAAQLPEYDLTEEELQAERRRRFRIAAGVGDLTAVLLGVAVILLLAALLISMITFVENDLSKSFSDWITRF